MEGTVVKVFFVCTDRDTHREVRLGHSHDWVPVIHARTSRNIRVFDNPLNEKGEWATSWPTRGTFALRTQHGRQGLSQYVTTWGDDPLNPDGTQFLCPKCGRNPQLRTENLCALMAEMKRQGTTRFDVSRLP